MAMGTSPDEEAPKRPKRRAPKGKARFEVAADGKALSVSLDRQGFRRLVETLERLAATGERQVFEKSGRGRRATGSGKAAGGGALEQLVFHIDGESK